MYTIQPVLIEGKETNQSQVTATAEEDNNKDTVDTVDTEKEKKIKKTKVKKTVKKSSVSRCNKQ